MNISTSPAGSVTVVRMQGNLDTGTSPEAQATLTALVDEGVSKILVNLGEVEFVSSAGLRILLATAKKLGTSGELRVSDLNETVKDVFEISGFSTILEVYGTEAEALEGF